MIGTIAGGIARLALRQRRSPPARRPAVGVARARPAPILLPGPCAEPARPMGRRTHQRQQWRIAVRLKDVMTSNVQVVAPDATIREAATLMKALDIGPLPVCDGRRLLGVVTDRDLTVRATADGRDPNTTRVREVMSEGVVTCFEDDDVKDGGATDAARADPPPAGAQPRQDAGRHRLARRPGRGGRRRHADRPHPGGDLRAGPARAGEAGRDATAPASPLRPRAGSSRPPRVRVCEPIRRGGGAGGRQPGRRA